MVTDESVLGGGTAEAQAALLPFESFAGFRTTLRADLRANRGDVKSQLVLAGLRVCQFLMRSRARPRRRSLPAVILYRLATEFVLGIELRPKTMVGPGLTIFHGTGLVVNDHALIGSGVTLRNGVVIGHKRPGERAPFVRDGVDVGAAALIIGAVTVGRSAKVGAGAVVVRDVPDGDTVVGNPARSVRR
ncbi:serine O-acetyltransferase [Curtobacterium flaccumfaciens]|uniref:serine O-acetyltransferase n=1 Tax=Curtobacterium flaccumfaciens TaxID=2035 RepID=UPI002175D039|nr:serine acetyltransferase [Curtobacterium flaccumfaciens]MCS5494492.1 serine acetyltransferase [Curtobacterium flaccumfaciens pv. flaccumfaciens]